MVENQAIKTTLIESVVESWNPHRNARSKQNMGKRELDPTMAEALQQAFFSGASATTNQCS